MRRLAVLFLAFVCLVIPPNSSQTAPQQNRRFKSKASRIASRSAVTNAASLTSKHRTTKIFTSVKATPPPQDRLWQMDLFRRTARGELAEVLGAGPNNVALDQDKLHRTYGFAQAAEAEVCQCVATIARDAGSLRARC